MPAPIEQVWGARGLRFELRDPPGSGFLGFERITDGLLTERSLVLRGRRFGGLDAVLPLARIRKVSQRLVPELTLVVHTDRGTIDVPAGAHDIVAVQDLCEQIEEAMRRFDARFESDGENDEDRLALDALLSSGGVDRD